jgi:hypothetical protein
MRKYLEKEVSTIVFRDPVPRAGTMEERIGLAQQE